MSPESVDPLARTKRRPSAAPAAPSTPSPLDLWDAGSGLDATGPSARILPAILDPFAQGAAPAVMSRIALDLIIHEHVLTQLFQSAPQDQYCREWRCEHLVNVMIDAPCSPPP